MAASIVIVILVLLIFGSSPIVEMILKMRRMKKGDDIIKAILARSIINYQLIRSTSQY